MVRAALEADVPSAELAAVMARLQDAGVAKQTSNGTRRKWRIVTWGGGAAACLVLAYALAGYWAPSKANAYSIVSSASSALEISRDRCYRLDDFLVPAIWSRGMPFLQKEVAVWTRGDRFRIVAQKDGKAVYWGQDERERIWGALDRRRGIRYDADELPAPFLIAVQFLRLDLRQLTSELLTDYDLKSKRDKPGTIVIDATFRNRSGSWRHFNYVHLEIEEATSVIRRMRMTKKVQGDEVARFSFTLIDERPLADDDYRLEGNLDSDGVIFDRTRRPQRQKLFSGVMNASRK